MKHQALVTEWIPWPALFCIAGAVLFMLTAVFIFWPTPEFAFASDQSVVSWLSSAQLWGIALLALRLGVDRALPSSMACWLFTAMLAMACDEQFMLHEQWKYGCFQWWSACQYPWMTELPMLLVGLLGLLTAIRLHRLLPIQARRLLWAAVLIGLLALALDQFALLLELPACEEALEVLAEAFFIAALIGVRRPLGA